MTMKIDRTGWPSGQWDNEPDRVDWQSHSLPCVILRNDSGALCGYVGVRPEHPLYGVGYDETSPVLEAALEQRKQSPIGEHPSMGLMLSALCGKVEAKPDIVFQVHGGLTYSNTDHDRGPGYWWFGFDCAHCDDFIPSYTGFAHRSSYRDIKYVKVETESLAKQLANISVVKAESRSALTTSNQEFNYEI